MPIKGQFTAGACVLFERPVPLDVLADALAGFDIAGRNEEPSHPAFGGPSVSVAFRPEVNGYAAVHTNDRPWPDHMGDPNTDPMLFGAWSMGHYGPFTFPGGLKRASQQCWAWPDGKTVPERHIAFVSVLTSYVFGGVPADTPVFPADYEPLAELAFVTAVARAVLRLPGAVCYFNPNGEALRTAAALDESLAFAEQQSVPPLDVYCNVRLFNVDDGWLVMDTVGNGQLGLPDLPDLEACVLRARGYDLGQVDVFLRNTTLYLLERGEVFADGDTIDGPGGVRWRARVRRNGLIDPPRRTLRFFPEDGTEPPAVLMADRGEE